jgi:hypothetical protein
MGRAPREVLMFISLLLDQFPVWGIFLGTILYIMVSAQAGIGLANLIHLQYPEANVHPGAAVAAAMGLLAFMLAIAFGASNSRLDERRHLVLDEANAIGTAYLRADVLPQPERDEMRCLLANYVAGRLKVDISESTSIKGIRHEAQALQGAMWKLAIDASEQQPNPPRSLLLSSLNELIDRHQDRVTIGLQFRMPGLFWITLFSLAGITMLLAGLDERLANGTHSYLVDLPIAIAFSLVFSLVVILDRPKSLSIASQQPLFDAQSSMVPVEACQSISAFSLDPEK